MFYHLLYLVSLLWVLLKNLYKEIGNYIVYDDKFVRIIEMSEAQKEKNFSMCKVYLNLVANVALPLKDNSSLKWKLPHQVEKD